ncbi:hypothetical protein [Leptothoe sp. PORK10 BA2]|uniref:hypothetical protein n=1 Tax=Leptothoe sp. PORK10 BA2 TaxID=3110254 RepID=UPI002B21838F|nr:hypothetical protein [Leptothoe sp. PORK10 BA2]MEA5464807.1 hypothetical protein [Leptothoe sp. PORK10 BA2]
MIKKKLKQAQMVVTEAAIEANNEQIRQLTGILQIAVRELESVQKESESRVQILINESREKNRQHAEFRRAFRGFREPFIS